MCITIFLLVIFTRKSPNLRDRHFGVKESQGILLRSLNASRQIGSPFFRILNRLCSFLLMKKKREALWLISYIGSMIKLNEIRFILYTENTGIYSVNFGLNPCSGYYICKQFKKGLNRFCSFIPKNKVL